MKKVLLVNGIRKVIEEEKRLLSGRDILVFTASSGEEALDIHRREKVDLIITGLDLSGMSGETLCSIVRNDEDLRRVSLLTVCSNRESDLERCAYCGVNSYMTKPIDPDRFMEKVNWLLSIARRTGVRVLIKVSTKGALKYHAFFCTTLNISTTGMLIETDRIIAKGEMITCSFFIPGSDNIVGDCEVVRAVKTTSAMYQYGLKFLELSSTHQSAIQDFVRKRLVE